MPKQTKKLRPLIVLQTREKSPASDPVLPAGRSPRLCNLCQKKIFAQSRFARFCSECRARNQVYRMAEWFPSTTLDFH